MTTEHPILADAREAIETAIVYSADPIASVLASRLLLELAPQITASGPEVAYGRNWDAILGVLRMLETLTHREDVMLEGELTRARLALRMRAIEWLEQLGQKSCILAAFADAGKMHRASEPVRRAIECGILAQMVHGIADRDTPVTLLDEVELAVPMRTVLKARGVVA